MGVAEHILVPTDFSEVSLRAVDVAAELARLTGARITLLHVVDPLIATGDAYGYGNDTSDLVARPELESIVSERLEALRATRLAGALDVRIEVAVGRSVAATIVDTSEALGVDLVCIASHGRTGLARMLLGSVAEQVVRMSERSVFPVMIPKEERREER